MFTVFLLITDFQDHLLLLSMIRLKASLQSSSQECHIWHKATLKTSFPELALSKVGFKSLCHCFRFPSVSVNHDCPHSVLNLCPLVSSANSPNRAHGTMVRCARAMDEWVDQWITQELTSNTDRVRTKWGNFYAAEGFVHELTGSSWVTSCWAQELLSLFMVDTQ